MKTALVTGGSQGIGAAIVRQLSADGWKVYFTFNSSEADARKLASEMKNTAALKCDVRDKARAGEIVDEILSKEETLDALVNNAGIIRDNLFLTMPDEDWQEVMDTNLGSVYQFCKAVLRQMLMQRSGRIVNISSIVGDLGGVGQANYAASKGAINSMTKSIAAEVAAKGITVNAVAPGMVSTKMSHAVRSAFGSQIKERIPVGEFAEPEDIAGIVSFLVSEKARYITGQIITVDGGLSLLSRR